MPSDPTSCVSGDHYVDVAQVYKRLPSRWHSHSSPSSVSAPDDEKSWVQRTSGLVPVDSPRAVETLFICVLPGVVLERPRAAQLAQEPGRQLQTAKDCLSSRGRLELLAVRRVDQLPDNFVLELLVPYPSQHQMVQDLDQHLELRMAGVSWMLVEMAAQLKKAIVNDTASSYGYNFQFSGQEEPIEDIQEARFAIEKSTDEDGEVSGVDAFECSLN